MCLPSNGVCSAVNTLCWMKIEYAVQKVLCRKKLFSFFKSIYWATQLFQGSRSIRCNSAYVAHVGSSRCPDDETVAHLLLSTVAFIAATESRSAAGGAATLVVLTTNMLPSSLCYMLNCFTCDHITQAVWSCSGLFYLCGGSLLWE